MNLFTLVFGEKPRRVITAPPSNASWKNVRATADHMPVRARRAEADCVMETGKGRLKARGGEDYIISYGPQDHAVIRKDVFEATYEPVGEDLYRKRTDVVFRYFTLPYACTVKTLEGPQQAKPGDWIMQGVEGELWPIPAEKAETKYDPA
ncbi:MAG: hypothetical protein DCF16_03050 [Alphaproteobacteria bacterium]|nr:MAG: hypothetical protein DCF16_03050 [Alphaproteobacteria bacterium]